LEVDRDGRAIVAVTLNGRGPFRLAVETGSPDVLLSSAVVADLALPPVTGLPRFRLDSLRVGDALVRGLEVGRNDAFARMGVDGVLGLDDLLLGGHRFERPRIAVHPLPPDIPSRMTIGTRVLRHFVLTLDQRSMAVRLVRTDSSVITDA